MTKPGPKKTPVAKLKRRRTYRSRRHAEPAKRSGTRTSVLKPPADLSKEAKKFWEQQAMGFVKQDLLRDTNLPIFANYCESLAEVRMFRNLLKKESEWFVQKTNRKKIQSPVADMLERALKRVSEFAAQLGITSSDRPDLDPDFGVKTALQEYLESGTEFMKASAEKMRRCNQEGGPARP